MKATHAPLLVQKSTKASRQTIGNADQVLSRWVSALRPDKFACPAALELHKKGTFNSKPTLDLHHTELLSALSWALKLVFDDQAASAPREVSHPLGHPGRVRGQHLKADTIPAYAASLFWIAGDLSCSLSAAFFQHLKTKTLLECTCLTAHMTGHV